MMTAAFLEIYYTTKIGCWIAILTYLSLLNMALEDGCSGLNTLLKCLTDLVLFGTCLLQSSLYKHFLLDTKSDTSHKNNYNETNE